MSDVFPGYVHNYEQAFESSQIERTSNFLSTCAVNSALGCPCQFLQHIAHLIRVLPILHRENNAASTGISYLISVNRHHMPWARSMSPKPCKPQINIYTKLPLIPASQTPVQCIVIESISKSRWIHIHFFQHFPCPVSRWTISQGHRNRLVPQTAISMQHMSGYGRLIIPGNRVTGKKCSMNVVEYCDGGAFTKRLEQRYGTFQSWSIDWCIYYSSSSGRHRAIPWHKPSIFAIQN